MALMGCASFLAGLGALERAAQIGGAAEALLERRDATLPDLYYRQYMSDYYRRYMSKLQEFKAQANEENWAVWWAEGRALSQEQAIMLALQSSQEMVSH
jgi:hypothetical protein